jgi:hypothetical protein
MFEVWKYRRGRKLNNVRRDLPKGTHRKYQRLTGNVRQGIAWYYTFRCSNTRSALYTGVLMSVGPETQHWVTKRCAVWRHACTATSNVICNFTQVLFNEEAFYCFKNNCTPFCARYIQRQAGLFACISVLAVSERCVYIEVDEDVDGCGALPGDCAVFIAVSATVSSLLFLYAVVAFNVTSDPSMPVAKHISK